MKYDYVVKVTVLLFTCFYQPSEFMYLVSPSIETTSPMIKKELDNVSLPCKVFEGNARPYNFTWTRKNRVIMTDLQYLELPLPLHRINQEDEGIYTCTVENQFGDKVSRNVHLIIKCKLSNNFAIFIDLSLDQKVETIPPQTVEKSIVLDKV